MVLCKLVSSYQRTQTQTNGRSAVNDHLNPTHGFRQIRVGNVLDFDQLQRFASKQFAYVIGLGQGANCAFNFVAVSEKLFGDVAGDCLNALGEDVTTRRSAYGSH